MLMTHKQVFHTRRLSATYFRSKSHSISLPIANNHSSIHICTEEIKNKIEHHQQTSKVLQSKQQKWMKER